MNKQTIIKYCLYYNLGTPVSVKKYVNAAVHHVYRVDTDKGVFFIKHRGYTYAKSPSLPLDPSEMRYEAIATVILHTIFPQNIPSKIVYDDKEAILVTSKIMDDEDNLEILLKLNSLNTQDFLNIGYMLGKLHIKMSSIKLLREPFDNEFYERNIYYKFLSLGYEPILPIVEQLRSRPRQLIFGDLSPKNIGISNDSVVFCDFDNAHIGNRHFDVGFLLGHLILHTFSRKNIDFISFINSYSNGLSDSIAEEDKRLIYKIALATCVYRLDNKWVNYKIDLGPTKSKRLLYIVKALLEDRGTTFNFENLQN